MSLHKAISSPSSRMASANTGWPPAATVAIVALSAAAWLAIASGWPGHNSPIASSSYSKAELLLAEATRTICGSPPGAGADVVTQMQWLAGWAIMIIAMMLPPAIPFLRTVADVSGEARSRLVSLAAIAFVGTWSAMGVLLVAGASIFSQMSLPDPLAQPALLAGTAAILVGAYQFTPMKKACLTACRSPRAVLLCHWNGERPAFSAVNAGLRYAAICIGCCWATMALTLIVGVHALPLMVIVSIIMLAERLLPWTRPLIPLQAGFAVALGIVLILGWLPSATSIAIP